MSKKKEHDLPSPDTVRKALEHASHVTPDASQEKYLARRKDEAPEIQEKYAHLQGVISHYKHKEYWSLFLMVVMGLMIFFQCFLLGMVGSNFWDFSKYKWLLPILLVQNLAQIIGLAVFVVKALFKEIR